MFAPFFQHKRALKQNEGRQKKCGSQEFTMAPEESKFQRLCAHDLDARCQRHCYWDQARTAGSTSSNQPTKTHAQGVKSIYSLSLDQN